MPSITVHKIKYTLAEQRTVSIFLNSFSQCRINAYIYILLRIFHRLDKSTSICHCIKVVQSRGMTIYYVMYINPFLKRCIDKNSILIPIFYKQTKENAKPTIQSITYYTNQEYFIAISPERNTYTIYSLGKGKVSGKIKCLKNQRFDLYPNTTPITSVVGILCIIFLKRRKDNILSFFR